MVTLIFTIVLLIGLVLLFFGVRGRVVDDHLICAKCGFDLHGVVNSHDQRQDRFCPECGAALDVENAVLVGTRMRNPFLLYGGFALLFFAMMASTISVWTMGRDGSTLAFQPTWWLVRQVTSADDALLLAPKLNELSKRIAQDKLTRESIDTLVKESLRRQAARDKYWETEWGDLLLEAKRKSHLALEDWQTYLKQGVHIESVLRPRVSLAETFVYTEDITVRMHTNADYALNTNVTRIDIGSALITLPKLKLWGTPVNLLVDKEPYAVTFEYLEGRLKPGRHPTKVKFELSLSSMGTELLAWDVIKEDEVEVVGGKSSITLDKRPHLRELIKSTLKPSITIKDDGQAIVEVAGYVPGVNLYFDVWSDDGGATPIYLGSYESLADAEYKDDGYFLQDTFTYPHQNAEKVKLIFKPAPHYAADTLEVTKVVGLEVVFEEVEIKR